MDDTLYKADSPLNFCNKDSKTDYTIISKEKDTLFALAAGNKNGDRC